MTARYLGSVTVGGALPGGVQLAAAGSAGINVALPSLHEQLAALVAYVPAPIDFGAQLAALKAMIQAVEASIALGLPSPSVAVQVAKIGELIAGLRGQIAAVSAHLELITRLRAAFGAAGVHLIAFDGQAGAMAAELGAELGSAPGLAPGDDAHAVLLATTVPATWLALSALLKVAP
jgi:hypothetical protein